LHLGETLTALGLLKAGADGILPESENDPEDVIKLMAKVALKKANRVHGCISDLNEAFLQLEQGNN